MGRVVPSEDQGWRKRLAHLAGYLAPPHEIERPKPPDHLPPARVVHVPGRGEMFLREQDGPEGAVPVLLLHGWTASADTTWWAVYPALHPSHPMIAVDHRGHGRGIRAEHPFSLEACADDAAALLELLEVGPVVVAGYSLGGAVAMLMYDRHPELVSGLVLSATALEWRTTFRERVVWRTVGVLEMALRLGTGDGFVQRYLHYAVAHAPDVADLRAWVGGEFKRGFSRDIAAAGRALSRFNAEDFVDEIEVPTAVVVTERDRLVRAQEQHDLAEALGAKVFTVDGDHDAPLVTAREFADRIVEAVNAVSP